MKYKFFIDKTFDPLTNPLILIFEILLKENKIGHNYVESSHVKHFFFFIRNFIMCLRKAYYKFASQTSREFAKIDFNI